RCDKNVTTVKIQFCGSEESGCIVRQVPKCHEGPWAVLWAPLQGETL
uniref:Uncharacterized protein n=1 Tax=Gasterosteus aculeatus TaxID=69293 RepID=G3NNJ3_GASAC